MLVNFCGYLRPDATERDSFQLIIVFIIIPTINFISLSLSNSINIIDMPGAIDNEKPFFLIDQIAGGPNRNGWEATQATFKLTLL